MSDRPPFITDEHLQALDHLQATGKLPGTNACTYLKQLFPDTSQAVAMAIVSWWLNNQGK